MAAALRLLAPLWPGLDSSSEKLCWGRHRDAVGKSLRDSVPCARCDGPRGAVRAEYGILVVCDGDLPGGATMSGGVRVSALRIFHRLTASVVLTDA